MRLIKFLSDNRWAVFFAALVGFIMILPQIYFRYDPQVDYRGIELNLGGADEIFYLTRIQEIRDGHFSLANPYWAEGKNLPYLRPPFSEILVVFVGWVFHLGLANAVLASRFLFAVFLFILIYFFILALFKNKAMAISAPMSVLFLTELVDPRSLWYFIAQGQVSHNFLTYSHLISPLTHSLFFFGFLLFLWLYLIKQKQLYGFISFIILGLSFYTYPYTWTFLYAFLVCLIIVVIWRKNWLWFKQIISISLGGLVISVFYFLEIWQASRYSLYAEMALRSGMIKSHAPQLGLVVIIIFVVFLLFFLKKTRDKSGFFLALALAPFLVLNQQIITGQSMIPAHYHWYFHKPLLIIFLTIIIFEQIDLRIKNLIHRKRINLILSGLILFINISYALTVQIVSYEIWKKPAQENQQYAPALKWLNENTKRDESVVAGGVFVDLIPIYTSLNITNALDAHYYLVSDENQLLERMFLIYRLGGLEAEEARARFLKDKIWIAGAVYGEYYRKGYGGRENMPDEKILYIAKKYQEFLEVPLEDIFKKYKINYLIWDKLNQPDWRLDKYSFLGQIYNYNNINIYKSAN